MKINKEGNNRRIVRNTAFLTFRMLIVVLISLYTARVVINALGVEDFGIYSVVGGVIGFLGVLNVSLVSASQRFLAYELGSNGNNYNNILNSLLLIFLIISLAAVFVGILLEPWIVYKILVYPAHKKEAVVWVYYLSLVTFCVNLISIPYMASIVAYERMDAFAYIGLVEAGLKLITAWLLLAIEFDKLKLYGILNALIAIFVFIFYLTYNLAAIKNISIKFYFEKKLFKKIFSYSGWVLFGSFTSIFNVNGQGLLLNIFFGPAVNAAKSVSDRINSVLSGFSNNFYTAVRPQLVKKYASGDVSGMIELACRSTKYSFYILLLVSLPMFVFTKELLETWLGAKNITIEMVIFVKLMIVFSWVNVFEQPITVMIHATGLIKRYEVSVGLLTLTLLPLSFVSFKLGAPSYASMLILIGLYFVAQFIRLYICKVRVNISFIKYFKIAFLPIMPVLFLTFIVTYFSIEYASKIFSIYFLVPLSSLLCGLFVLLVGLDQLEKNFLKNFIRNKFIK